MRGAILAFVVVLGAGTAWAQSARTLPYELKSLTTLTMRKPDGQTEKVQSEITLRYSWQIKNGQQTLILNSLGEKRSVNGREVASSLMQRESIRTQEPGRAFQLVSFRTASPTLQQVLNETFETPLVRLQTNGKGKVTKATVAKAGAEETIQKGYLSAALLLQAPPPPADDAQKEWTSDTELGFGNIGFAPGTLTYKPDALNGDGQRVKVSGGLANKDGKIDPHVGQRLYDVKYDVNGEQTWSPEHKQWLSARLSIGTGYKFTRDDKAIGTAKGSVEITMKSLK